MPNAHVAAADPGCPEEIIKTIEQEAEKRRDAARDRFNALFAEWLTNRAEYMRPGVDWTERDELAHSDREEELARLIVMTPPPLTYQVFYKLDQMSA